MPNQRFYGQLSMDELPNDVENLKALLLSVHAASLATEAKAASLAAEVDRLTARAARLDHIVSVLRRAHFGRRSERISDEQIELALEDVETQDGAEDAGAEKADTIVKAEGVKARRANRGHLPPHLPGEEIIVEPETKACPCCGGALHVIGTDVSERLDRIPARVRVIVARRPKYACLWVGFAAHELAPLHERLVAILKASPKLFADETRRPVLDPGRGKTKTGYLWAIARDDRPWSGADPPAVAYMYAPGRGAEHAAKLLAGFNGVLQVDGYAGYDKKADATRPGGPRTSPIAGATSGAASTTSPRAAMPPSPTRRSHASDSSMQSRQRSAAVAQRSAARNVWRARDLSSRRSANGLMISTNASPGDHPSATKAVPTKIFITEFNDCPVRSALVAAREQRVRGSRRSGGLSARPRSYRSRCGHRRGSDRGPANGSCRSAWPPLWVIARRRV